MRREGGKETESRQNNLFAKHTTCALATYWVHWEQGKAQGTSFLVFFITGMGLFPARKEKIKVWRAQEKITPIIHAILKNLLSCCKNEKWELIATHLHLQKNANLILQVWHYQDFFQRKLFLLVLWSETKPDYNSKLFPSRSILHWPMICAYSIPSPKFFAGMISSG